MENVNHLSNVWEQGTGSVSLTKSALFDLNTQRQLSDKYLSKDIGTHLTDAIQTIQNDSHSSASDNNYSSGSIFNYTQNITAPNPMPASKIYRTANNMLAKMKADIDNAKNQNNSNGVYLV